MDEDAPVDPADSETIQWRRDATTSRTVRLLWSFGVGTFFATITIIVLWRLYDVAIQSQGLVVLGALFGAILVTILVVTVVGDADRWLPGQSLTGPGFDRAVDATLGTIAMLLVIGGLMAAGRFVSQRELLGGVGAGPFTATAALLIPLALVALVLASFLRSVGVFDPADRVIYLYDPEQAIDLEVIEDVRTHRLGDAVVLTLSYAQPDGQYVPGPRRLAVPPAVATEIEAAVDATP
ncbi:hypothetical protein [Halopiger djelfimassiliensis]|uniref:hypothetical protein n=1 Tax=Halopiger djelfimassiliensis TaxID=1293047 RepID=UPI00067818B6|nr:hypothetical protein [Halopiger djelfimassiliensis]